VPSIVSAAASSAVALPAGARAIEPVELRSYGGAWASGALSLRLVDAGIEVSHDGRRLGLAELGAHLAAVETGRLPDLLVRLPDDGGKPIGYLVVWRLTVRRDGAGTHVESIDGAWVHVE